MRPLGLSLNPPPGVNFVGPLPAFDHAFRWTPAGGAAGTMVDLGTGTDHTDPTATSRAYGVSNDGTKIVGTRTYMPTGGFLDTTSAFLCIFSAGICTTIAEPDRRNGGTATVITPDGTLVAGQGENFAFRWTSGGTQDLGGLSGHNSSAALDISDNGSIVVGVSSLNPVSFGGLDSNGKAEAIVDFGASGLFARYNNATWMQLRPWTTQAICGGKVRLNAPR